MRVCEGVQGPWMAGKAAAGLDPFRSWCFRLLPATPGPFRAALQVTCSAALVIDSSGSPSTALSCCCYCLRTASLCLLAVAQGTAQAHTHPHIHFPPRPQAVSAPAADSHTSHTTTYFRANTTTRHHFHRQAHHQARHHHQQPQQQPVRAECRHAHPPGFREKPQRGQTPEVV